MFALRNANKLYTSLVRTHGRSVVHIVAAAQSSSQPCTWLDDRIISRYVCVCLCVYLVATMSVRRINQCMRVPIIPSFCGSNIKRFHTLALALARRHNQRQARTASKRIFASFVYASHFKRKTNRISFARSRLRACVCVFVCWAVRGCVCY